jgi:isopenicillin N synthase-like dioxygenase
MAFNAIPVLDLSLSRDPATKPAFLASLRKALLEVGFLYISNTGIADELIEGVIKNGRAFFDLPSEAKLAVQMKNEKSFLGYNVLGGEVTAHKIDWREQIDLSTPHPVPSPDAPKYRNLLAPNQWPSSQLLPEFRPAYETYIREMSKLCRDFTSLIAEAIGLSADAFDRFFDADQQHKLKIVRYPDLDELGVPKLEQGVGEEDAQGVGPHKDSMLTSYLLQASHHRGLQAQNLCGDWIDCEPIAGTLVVAIGQGLEALTRGVCASTTHRVLAPGRGEGARYSVPFFQGVSYDAEFANVDVPADVVEEKEAFVARNGGRRDDVEFTFRKGKFNSFGESTLYNRCKSHMDVAERWYPELWRMVLEDREKERTQEAELDAEVVVQKESNLSTKAQGAAVGAH